MDEPRNDFGERLLDVESVNSQLKARYQQAVRALLEMEVRGFRIIVPVLVLVVSLTVAFIFGMAAVMSWTGGMPLLARVTFVLAAAFGGAVVVLTLWVLGRGAINLRVGSTVAGLGWAVMAIVIALFMLQGAPLIDTEKGLRIVLIGMVFLIFAAVGLVMNGVHRAELRTREKLLEIEYRLAELAEQAGRKHEV